MALILKNNDDEVLEGNKYYWKITKLLHDLSSRKRCGVGLPFKIHSKIWHNYFISFKNIYISLHASDSICDDIDHLFDLRVGIVGDDLKEIVVKEVFSIVELISCSELDSIRRQNKIVYLFIEIRRKDEKFQKISARKEQIQTDYRDLLLSGKNSDVTLNVKQKKFHCHRCILAARSPVFATMMKNEVEKTANGEVIIEDAEPNVFQKFLLFLYTGKDDYIIWQNITDLYKLAVKYGVEEIKKLCRNDIKENISSRNFCEFFNLSLLHDDPELTKMIVQFSLTFSRNTTLYENWMTFLSEDSNKRLSADHIKGIITTENFFFFFKLSQIQNDSELTKTTVQFFLKNLKDIIGSENWVIFQAKNVHECRVLVKALRQITKKVQSVKFKY